MDSKEKQYMLTTKCGWATGEAIPPGRSEPEIVTNPYLRTISDDAYKLIYGIRKEGLDSKLLTRIEIEDVATEFGIRPGKVGGIIHSLVNESYLIEV